MAHDLNALLESRYGFRLEEDEEHLLIVSRLYEERKELLMMEHGISVINTPEYSKCVLLCGVSRMMLREIAPRRTKKRKE